MIPGSPRDRKRLIAIRVALFDRFDCPCGDLPDEQLDGRRGFASIFNIRVAILLRLQGLIFHGCNPIKYRKRRLPFSASV